MNHLTLAIERARELACVNFPQSAGDTAIGPGPEDLAAVSHRPVEGGADARADRSIFAQLHVMRVAADLRHIHVSFPFVKSVRLMYAPSNVTSYHEHSLRP